MDDQMFQAFQSRFDTLEQGDREQMVLLRDISSKVAVNQTHIHWLRWSLRGVWVAGTGVIAGWFGMR